MPGLLADLEALAQAADLGGLVQGQVGNLTGITNTVTQLLDGPVELSDLLGVIGNVPVPPALDGIASLVPTITGIVNDAPADAGISTALAPLIAPITDLVTGDGLAAGVGATVAASLEGLRALIDLAGGGLLGGASGAPLAALLWGRQGMPSVPHPDLSEIRARIAEVTGLLDDNLGEVDAEAVLTFLRRAAGAWAKPSPKWPTIPVITETMEALDTVGRWQDMDGPTLTASLQHTLAQVAELVATPRTRVAGPYLAAAAEAGAAPETLAAAQQALQPLIVALRNKVLVTGVEPTGAELRALEAQVIQLEATAAALGGDSPLADVDALPSALEKQMLRVVRALSPAYDMAPLAARLRSRLAELPAAPDEPLGDAVQAVEDLDISVITGPLQAIKGVVEDAVEAVNDVKNSVRDELTGLLSPIDTALAGAITAIGLPDIISALQGLPATLQSFIDDQVTPQVEGVKNAISGAVTTVSNAANAFDPDALLAPIREALEGAADRLSDNEVTAVFQQLDEALSQAITAIENLDLAPAADESISLLEDIEAKLAAIDPNTIPDAAKPLLRQAVQVVTDVDFTGEVATPIVRGAEEALQAGPAVLLTALEDGLAQVRTRIEAFRPSQVVGEALDQPFQDLLATLRQFQPSDLLQQLADALDQVAAQVSVLDVGVVIEPIEAIHADLVAALEKLRPSNLMRPVEEAIEAAVAKVFEVAGIDDLFDGVNDVLDTINDGVALLDDTRASLVHLADLLADVGDGEAALQSLVDAAVAKLDDVALAELGGSFAAVAAAVEGSRRDAIAGDIARSFRNAADRAPVALASAALTQVRALAEAFPRAELATQAPVPSRRRLRALIDRLDRASAGLVAARSPWTARAERLGLHAGRIQEDLIRYHRVTLNEGGTVFDDLAVAPASTAALREAVAEALEDGLREPVSVTMAAVQALAPYIEKLARDLAAFIAAVHTKLDSITGEDGLSGTVGAVEDVADLLRDIDLTPITDPLDTIWGRIEGAIGGLSPTPLRLALEAARDALAGLLSLSTLLGQEEIDLLDQTYRTVLEKLEQLSPGRIISQTLDPLYEELLAAIVPVLDMPTRLRELVETVGRNLGDEILEELARVEVAFDRMLRALPLDGGGGGASGEISVGVAVG
ncbi:hypothetical protein [Haliangium sp.]|uniref:hypothetical protein n=1 Tax=Haliangium sp. TaxID=2663208 RepID=UPI003D103668